MLLFLSFSLVLEFDINQGPILQMWINLYHLDSCAFSLTVTMQDTVAVKMSKEKLYLYIIKYKLLCISGNAKKKTVTFLFFVRESSCIQNVLCFNL